jgi:protein-tyrosine-phosphatase
MFSVLVVCTGNSCRSPMAQGILAGLLESEPVLVYSAGTDAPAGMPATAHAVTAASELGADIGMHRAQQLTRELVRSADLILVMEEYHRQRVVELDPDAADRTKMLGGYPDGEREVGDPVGRPLEVYRRTAEEMRSELEKVAEDVRRRLGI